MELNFTEFKSIGEDNKGETEERLRKKPTLTYGIDFLDDATSGIKLGDTIVLTAKTGIGKTTYAVDIAEKNALRGFKIHYFALEAKKQEIAKRIKFKQFLKLVRQDGHKCFLSFGEWEKGNYYNDFTKQEILSNKYLDETLNENLFVRYRKRDFSIEDFEKEVINIKDETDLVIMDHLHYVDLESDMNENSALKQTLKSIRQICLDLNKPVILVAHVRKEDRRYQTLIPTIEDIHGSSDIAKIATEIITFGTIRDRTLMRVAKSRINGQARKYLSSFHFNYQTMEYDKEYHLYDYHPTELKDKLEKEDYPFWIDTTKLESDSYSLF